MDSLEETKPIREKSPMDIIVNNDNVTKIIAPVSEFISHGGTKRKRKRYRKKKDNLAADRNNNAQNALSSPTFIKPNFHFNKCGCFLCNNYCDCYMCYRNKTFFLKPYRSLNYNAKYRKNEIKDFVKKEHDDQSDLKNDVSADKLKEDLRITFDEENKLSPMPSTSKQNNFGDLANKEETKRDEPTNLSPIINTTVSSMGPKHYQSRPAYSLNHYRHYPYRGNKMHTSNQPHLTNVPPDSKNFPNKVSMYHNMPYNMHHYAGRYGHYPSHSIPYHWNYTSSNNRYPVHHHSSIPNTKKTNAANSNNTFNCVFRHSSHFNHYKHHLYNNKYSQSSKQQTMFKNQSETKDDAQLNNMPREGTHYPHRRWGSTDDNLPNGGGPLKKNAASNRISKSFGNTSKLPVNRRHNRYALRSRPSNNIGITTSSGGTYKNNKSFARTGGIGVKNRGRGRSSLKSSAITRRRGGRFTTDGTNNVDVNNPNQQQSVVVKEIAHAPKNDNEFLMRDHYTDEHGFTTFTPSFNYPYMVPEEHEHNDDIVTSTLHNQQLADGMRYTASPMLDNAGSISPPSDYEEYMEELFLEKDFAEEYELAQNVRLQAMTKSELIQEVLFLQAQLEDRDREMMALKMHQSLVPINDDPECVNMVGTTNTTTTRSTSQEKTPEPHSNIMPSTTLSRPVTTIDRLFNYSVHTSPPTSTQNISPPLGEHDTSQPLPNEEMPDNESAVEIDR